MFVLRGQNLFVILTGLFVNKMTSSRKKIRRARALNILTKIPTLVPLPKQKHTHTHTQTHTHILTVKIKQLTE